MKRILLGSTDAFQESKPMIVSAGGVSLVVVRLGQQVYAVQNRCPHLGLPLGNGPLDGTTITCPWHGSQFDVCSGRNLDWVRGIAGVRMPNWSRKLLALGREPQPLTTYSVIEQQGELFVELAAT